MIFFHLFFLGWYLRFLEIKTSDRVFILEIIHGEIQSRDVRIVIKFEMRCKAVNG
jgi:hypothetical protein